MTDRNDTEKIFFKCEGQIATDMWHPHKCGQKASVEREGKWYCKRHDPVALNAKRDEKEKAWNARFNKDMAEARSNRAAVASVDDLLRAVKLVLALDGQPEVFPEFGTFIPWVVRLDPKAKEQLQNAVKKYEDMIQSH